MPPNQRLIDYLATLERFVRDYPGEIPPGRVRIGPSGPVAEVRLEAGANRMGTAARLLSVANKGTYGDGVDTSPSGCLLCRHRPKRD